MMSTSMNLPQSPAQQLLSAVDVMTGSLRNVSTRKYNVMYIGQTLLDKRYTQPHFWKCILPWLVPEVKATPNPQRVSLQVQGAGIYTLQGLMTGSDKIVFEHKLHQLSKFSRIHADTKCFVYLTKANGDNFLCHVFQAPDDRMVVELFQAIREATKQALSDPTQTCVPTECTPEYARMTPASLFEIMYIGKMPVSNKKASPTFVDEAVEKFVSYEEKKLKAEEQERRRHASGTSVRSLPVNLEQTVSVQENELIDQGGHSRVSESSHSSHSSESDISGSSSTENMLNNNTMSGKVDQMETLQEGITRNEADKLQRMAIYNQSKKNRTMLLQITANEVCLINTDKKKVIMKRSFRDISFCSQGISNPQHFGFITKDVETSAFLCYVFMCATEQVVKDVMQTLKQAFMAAFQQSSKNIICELCPMQQLQKLCEDIHELVPEQAYELIMRRIMQLNEQDQIHIMTRFQNKCATLESHQEMNEVLICILRHLSESKQQNHTHVSDANRNHVKNEFNLSETSKSALSLKIDDFRSKAKKSLSNSFESLKKSKTKLEEAREAFRRKSWITESTDYGQSFDSSISQSADNTPLTSPLSKHAPIPHEFSPSPDVFTETIRRKRSSSESYAEERKAELEYNGGVRINLTRLLEESPRRHMFNVANSSSSSAPRPRPPSPPSGDRGAGGDSLPGRQVRTMPRRQSSWRLQILNKVVTPARVPPSSNYRSDRSEESLSSSPLLTGGKKLGSEAVKQLWRKAILETLLMIRMEKEKMTIKAHQDEEETRKKKLDYEEITPCLKEVTKVWEGWLSSPDRGKPLSWDRLNAAVQDGVPRTKRGDIWLLLMGQHKLHKRPRRSLADDISLTHSYTQLLKMLTTHQHAILIDLGRTFPSHPYFSTQLGAGQLSLFNILKAYSLRDKEVGYCQGLSFVAGILLMHMPEEQAFETMQYFMFDLGFRRQYRPDMVALQIQLYQLSRLLHDNYRDLYEHFELYDIAPTLYAAAWFLTLFASQFPLGFVARVYDLIFLQGMDVVFKVALVLLGNHKELIKQCMSFESIVDFLKTTLPGMGIIQMERIINQVFCLDISAQLAAYEVEYHVLQEEMISTPQRSDVDVVAKLETANHNLKRQNLELLEKLQTANNTCHSLEEQVQGLNTCVKNLEAERLALLNTIKKLRTRVPHEAQEQLNIPEIKADVTLSGSPVHLPMNGDGNNVDLKTASLTELNKEVEELMDCRRRDLEAQRRGLSPGRREGHRPRSSNT